jgi:hypothetical protein
MTRLKFEDTKVHSKLADCKVEHCMTRLKFEDTKVHSKLEDCKAEHCMTRLKFEDTKVHIWSAPWFPQASTVSYNV